MVILLISIMSIFPISQTIIVISLMIINMPIVLGLSKILKIRSIKSLIRIKQIKELLVVKERYCILCEKSLIIQDFYSVNRNLSVDNIAELWNNEYYEFYCCDCFIEVDEDT
jgi:hypothetical protein